MPAKGPCRTVSPCSPTKRQAARPAGVTRDAHPGRYRRTYRRTAESHRRARQSARRISHDGSCATRTTQPSGEDSPRVSVLEPGGRGLRGPLTSSAIVCRDGRISSGSRRRWLHRGPLGCGSRCGGSGGARRRPSPARGVVPAAGGRRAAELDLRRADDCRQAVDGARQVYNLAADMGGMGFIELNKALCMLSSNQHAHARSVA